MSKVEVPNLFSVHDFNSLKIFRSKKPISQNEIDFLISLGCRTFINLGDFPSSIERQIVKENKMKLVHIPLGMMAHEFSSDEGYSHYENKIKAVLSEISQAQGKVLLYDNDGFSNVGVVCAIMRRSQYWSDESWTKEFLKFSPPGWWNQSVIDFISKFNVADL